MQKRIGFILFWGWGTVCTPVLKRNSKVTRRPHGCGASSSSETAFSHISPSLLLLVYSYLTSVFTELFNYCTETSKFFFKCHMATSSVRRHYMARITHISFSANAWRGNGWREIPPPLLRLWKLTHMILCKSCFKRPPPLHRHELRLQQVKAKVREDKRNFCYLLYRK